MFLLQIPYFYHKRLIKKSYKWSNKQIQAFWSRMPSTRLSDEAVFTKENIRTSKVQTCFENIPILTKKASTGGTTGRAFVFYQNRFWTRQKERAYIFDIWREVGYKPFDLRVVVRGNFSKNLYYYNWFENAFYVSPSEMKEENKNIILRFFNSLPRFFLHCYPSSLLALQDYLGEAALRNLHIAGVLAGSEFFPPAQMKSMEEKYNFKIAHWYGHSEYAILARYCRVCEGFHFYPTYGKAEFISTNTKGIFKIIASSFNKFGTRFIRYDTEDLAVVDDGHCPVCDFPRVKQIIGREQEYFYDMKGLRHPFGPYLFGLHGDFWEIISDIQFIQRKYGELEVILVATESSLAPKVESLLKQRFSHVKLNFIYARYIEKSLSNKTRYFIRTVK